MKSIRIYCRSIMSPIMTPDTLDLPFEIIMIILGFIGKMPPMHPILSSILRKHLDKRICSRCGEYMSGPIKDRVYCMCIMRRHKFIDRWRPVVRPIVHLQDCYKRTNIHHLSPTRYRFIRDVMRLSDENAITISTSPIMDQFFYLGLMIKNLEMNNRCILNNDTTDDIVNGIISKFAAISIEERYSTKRFIIMGSPSVQNPAHILVSDMYPHTIDINDRPVSWEEDARTVFNNMLSFLNGHDPLGLLPPQKIMDYPL